MSISSPSKVQRKHLEFNAISEPMTIPTLLELHGTSLPVLLKVSQGYASFLDKYSFGKDQLFVALEKKEIDLATVRDPRTKRLYEIPLDEELVVSPVLPDCFTEEGIPSLLSARELLGCSTLPRAFCAMKPFKDSKGHLVEQGTLLFTLKEGNPLVAITQGNVKICIDKSTVGEFSVRSSNTKVSLKEAVKYLKFPISFRLLVMEDIDCYANKITVEKVSKGVVIQGMMKSEEGNSTTVTSFQKPSIIPAALQIQVTIMKTSEIKTLESIYDYATKTYYTSLLPLNHQHNQEYQPLTSDTNDTNPPHYKRITSAIASRPHIKISHVKSSQQSIPTWEPQNRSDPPYEAPLILTTTTSNPAQPATRREYLEVEAVSEPMTIAEFLQLYSTSLPLLLKFSHGNSSVLDKYSFGKDQLFVALEKKEIDLATVRDPGTNQLHELPLDEELLLSPVLPDSFAEEGIPSLLNSKELLGCSALPRAFCAMKPFKDAKGHLVEQGTLLFPHKSGNPLVAITKENRKVYIDKSTVGEFSVRFSNTKMLLKEAVKYLKLPFTCRLLASKEIVCLVHKIIVERVSNGLVILGMMKTKGGSTVYSFQKPLIISISLQNQVTIMKMKTSKILESIYDYASRAYHASSKPSNQPCSPRHQIHDQGHSSYTRETRVPCHSRRASTISTRPLSHFPQSTDFQARNPSSLRGLSKSHSMGAIPVAIERLCDRAAYSLPSENVLTTPADPQVHHSQSSSAASSQKENDEDLERGNNYENRRETDTQGKLKIKNIQALKKMTVNEVLLLLEKMNLSQYRDAFKEEMIDGISLSKLDNEMLEELGVKKRVHKMRLKNFIEGEQSVEEFNLVASL